MVSSAVNVIYYFPRLRLGVQVIWLLEQKEHLEQQKDRLLELLETTKDFEQRLRVEKIILDIEGKITNLVIKIAGFDYQLIPKLII